MTAGPLRFEHGFLSRDSRPVGEGHADKVLATLDYEMSLNAALNPNLIAMWRAAITNLRAALADTGPVVDREEKLPDEETIRTRIKEWLGPQRMSLFFEKDIDSMVKGVVIWDALRRFSTNQSASTEVGKDG